MLLLFHAAQNTAFAGSATWNLNPADKLWNSATNWTPATVPNRDSDIATFGVSNTTDVVISANTTVAEIVFEPGASAYTISAGPGEPLNINQGISNNSGITQNFKLPALNAFNLGGLVFHNTATAGSATTYTLQGGTAGMFDYIGGLIYFFDSSSADNATFFCNGGTTFNAGGGTIRFIGTSSAGSASFTNRAVASRKGAARGGSITFFESSTASNGTFINDGAMGSRRGAGFTVFGNNSHGAQATLIANGGQNGGPGGAIQFVANSEGGMARVAVSGNGNLNIAFHRPPSMAVGSIEGNGKVFLGAKNLTVGSNNRDTTFSGVIQDGEINPGGGTGGSLTKVGTGRLVLRHHANTYTGGTTINDGKLAINNTNGSGTGSGPVQVNGGVLGGRGTIAGDVTIGDGSGPGAVLSPGNSALTRSTLTIQSTLTFNSDGNYHFWLNTDDTTADKVVALGVTINSGAQFSFADAGANALPTGTVFTVISNTAVTPIAGTFSNLADGSTFTNNGNSYYVDYEGGDGNNLTLTVVP